MSVTKLPLWYPLQEVGAVDFTITKKEEINQLIESRLELLRTKEGQELQQDVLESDEEYSINSLI